MAEQAEQGSAESVVVPDADQDDLQRDPTDGLQDLDDSDGFKCLDLDGDRSPSAAQDVDPQDGDDDEEQEEEPPAEEEKARRRPGKGSSEASGKGSNIGEKANPRAKSKAKAKPNPKSNGKSAGGISYKCRSCDKMKAETQFHSGSVYCVPCRSMMDSLTRLAVAQGEQAWWLETRNNPKLLKACLKKYNEEAPATVDRSGRARRPKWSILTYKEEIIASSKVQFIERGKMMTKKRYLAWAQTVEGGKLTEQEAEDQWREWENMPDGEVHRDNAGKGGIKRIRVVVDDDVDFVGSYGTKKSLEMKSKENRKATAEDVAAQKKYLMDHHDQIGGVSSGCHELAGVARGMLDAASVGRQKFDLEGAMPIRISRLKRAATDEESGQEQDVKAGKASKAGSRAAALSSPLAASSSRNFGDTCSVSGKSSAGASGSGRKRAKEDAGANFNQGASPSEAYFDFNKAAASSYEAWALTMEELRTGFMNCKTDIEEVIRLYNSADVHPDVRSFVKYRLDLLKPKQKAVGLVMNGQSLPEAAAQNDLDIFIKGCVQLGAATTELDKTPPSSKYQQLVLLDKLETMSQAFFGLTTREAFTQKHKQHAVPLGALRELLSVSKAAVGDIKKAAAQKEKAISARKPAGGKVKAAPARAHEKKKEGIGNFGDLLALIPDMPVHSADEVKAKGYPDSLMNGSVPFITTNIDWAKKFSAQLSAELDTFKPIYNDSELKTKTGRGQRVVKDRNLKDQILQDCLNMLPGKQAFIRDIAADNKELLAAQCSVLTALAAGRKEVRVEKDALATVKVNLEGTREVVVAPIKQLVDIMVGEGFDETKVDLGSIYGFIGAMDRGLIEIYLRKHAGTMWKATQGPGDMMYAPAGIVQVQRVLSNSDNISLRFCCITKDPLAKEALKCASELTGGSNAAINAALALLG